MLKNRQEYLEREYQIWRMCSSLIWIYHNTNYTSNRVARKKFIKCNKIEPLKKEMLYVFVTKILIYNATMH